MEKYFIAKSFGLCLFLIGAKHRPVRAEPSEDGRPRILFPLEARDDMGVYMKSRDLIDELVERAKEQGQ